MYLFSMFIFLVYSFLQTGLVMANTLNGNVGKNYQKGFSLGYNKMPATKVILMLLCRALKAPISGCSAPIPFDW